MPPSHWKVNVSLFPFSESDLDDCRFPCQGNSPRESLSSQYVWMNLFWWLWWKVLGHNMWFMLWKWGNKWNIHSSFTHQMKHDLDTCSHYHYHCCCSQINLYFCEQQQETSTKVTAWIIKRNTNHSHRVLLVVSPLGRSSDFFLTRRCFSPPPHPGLLWAVSLFCSTREMGWVQESDPVLRMSLQPARILSYYWRNMAMERWESTVSEAWKTVFFTWKQRILSLFIGI